MRHILQRKRCNRAFKKNNQMEKRNKDYSMETFLGTFLFLMAMFAILFYVGQYWRQKNKLSESEVTEYKVKIEHIQVGAPDQPSPGSLYARSASIIDAETGRVLWSKDGESKRAMASTTKVMTCILALELGSEEDIYTVSAYAASMPKVKLGVKQGEQYRMGDLLYALMLESYNDSAVILAEGLAGSVEAFADKMNEKAMQLGLTNTHFVTPNGLDADGHETTAEDLAHLMAYAIQNERFLEITRTMTYSFSDLAKKRRYGLSNKNTLFCLYDKTISGKTGYTAEAGYCFTGAVEVEDTDLTYALLGSGWPPQKAYKWSDSMKLIRYCEKYYQKKAILDHMERIWSIPTTDGKSILCRLTGHLELLLSEYDDVKLLCEERNPLPASVLAGEVAGRMTLLVNDVPVWTGLLKTMEAGNSGKSN